ncbi:MAG: VOC family protein [Pseudomonadota bacterium]
MTTAGWLGPLGAARVFTVSFDAALGFYRDRLGLALDVSQPDVAIFDTGGCRLILEGIDPDSSEDRSLVGRFAGLSFTVEDLAASYRTLSQAGVAFLGPPVTQDWGGQLAHFKDPDGNILSLVQYP